MKTQIGILKYCRENNLSISDIEAAMYLKRRADRQASKILSSRDDLDRSDLVVDIRVCYPIRAAQAIGGK